ncbi:MAG: hypothetical protein DRH90_23085 [Deltaproteobacteria bacterium]|nr:MAG: hypothetical protein DRH90_23085 [Deltaproteobacteria bacterium]
MTSNNKEGAVMKMRDLVKRTGVSREKIHFFTREKMLPSIEKPSPNQAIYNEKHVERIQLILHLQDKYYIPIPVIKQIIKQLETSPLEEELLWIKTSYFKPMDHFLPQEIRGEDEFLKFSGLSADRLVDLETYGIIVPLFENDIKVYQHDSIKLGKLIGDMRQIGISHEKGFSRTGLKEVRDMLVPIIDHTVKIFDGGRNHNQLQNDAAKKLAKKSIEYTSLFIYHMSHYLLENAHEKYFDKARKDMPKS